MLRNEKLLNELFKIFQYAETLIYRKLNYVYFFTLHKKEGKMKFYLT